MFGNILIFITCVFLFILFLIICIYKILIFKNKIFISKHKPFKYKFYDTPIIIGHRGMMNIEMENTLSSFKKIISKKIDGTELDTMLTKDGELIVFHDYNLKRFFNKNINIYEIKYEELKKYKLINFDLNKEVIPKLKDVLLELKEVKLINIELKDEFLFNNALEEKLSYLLEKVELNAKIIISSFNPFAISRFKKINPDYATGLILSKKNVPFYIKKNLLLSFSNCDYVHFHVDYLNDPDFVLKFKNKGFGICFWDVNNINQFLNTLKYEPDFIISNVPDILRKSLIKIKNNNFKL